MPKPAVKKKERSPHRAVGVATDMMTEKSQRNIRSSPVSYFGNWRGFAWETPMYALFEGKKQIGSAFPTEKEVWEAALIEGLVTDVPDEDEGGSRIIPAGYHVEELRNGGG